MLKRELILLTWIFTIAVSILLVLYSPIGSPDLYRPRKYFDLNQGVSFSGRIQNAPNSIKSFQETKDAISSLTKDVEVSDYKIDSESNNIENIEAVDPTTGNEIPVYTNRPRPKYTALNVPTSTSNNAATYSVSQSSSNSLVKGSASGGIAGGQFSKSNGSAGSNGGGGIPSYSLQSRSASNNNSQPQVNGFTAISIDMSAFMDSTNNNFFAVNDGMQKGASDPGSDPIPVGEGWWLLLFFAAFYAVFKAKQNLLKMR